MRFGDRGKKQSSKKDGNETERKIETGKKDALKEKATASEREREGKGEREKSFEQRLG